MRTPDEHKLDRQFREGLTGSEGNSVFREEDWEDMERLLDESQPRRRGLFWLYLASASIAAALLMFLAWPLLRQDEPVEIVKKRVVPKKQVDKITQGSGDPESRVVEGAVNTAPEHTRDGRLANGAGVGVAAAKDNTGSVPAAGSVRSDISFLPLLAASRPWAPSIFPDLRLTLARHATVEIRAGGEVGNGSTEGPKGAEQNTSVGKRPAVALAIVTAPDINGVNSLSGGKIGANVGLLLSVKILPRLSISTGLAYAVKPYAVGVNGTEGAYGNYSASGSTYGAGGTAGNAYGGNSYGYLQTRSVDANCKVLDVPLNINYQIYRSPKSAVSAGTGVSSYFMLHETYKFNYTDNTSWSYHVSNKNRHLFGVLNINASYQRQMNTRLSLVVQPYLKIPLTDIGNEGVDLRSAGVAFGVGWTINSRKK